MKIAITTDIRHPRLKALCPDSLAADERFQIVVNPPPLSEADFWITFARALPEHRLIVAPENTLFIAGEPPTKKIYPTAYYDQFHHIVSCNPLEPHPRRHLGFLGLPWHAGMDKGTNTLNYDYTAFANLKMPKKANLVSVVCSDAEKTEGQRQRLRFLQKLKEQLGDKIIHYGRGFQPVGDKLEAISPYRFHLALENCQLDHYWTEKLSDAFLGWSFPIYLGAPNIGEYFPTRGLCPVSLDQVDAAVDKIGSLLAAEQTDEEIRAIDECRNLVLNDYNPFTRFAYWAEKLYCPDRSKAETSVRDHRSFKRNGRWLTKWFQKNPKN